MSDAIYHAGHGVSRSDLMLFRESRRKFEAVRILKTVPPKEETPAMQCGTLTHCAILQGHKLDLQMAIIPNELLSDDGGLRSKAAKEWKAAAEASGKIVVKDHQAASTLAPIIGMRDAILASDAGHWFRNPKAICEKSIKWVDEETGLTLKALPDFRLELEDQHIATDVKTIADISKAENAIADSYWMQVAHYTAGMRSISDKPVTFTFLFVEKEPPYLVRCLQMVGVMANEAERLWRQTLREFKECVASGNWADPQEGIVIPVDRKIW